MYIYIFIICELSNLILSHSIKGWEERTYANVIHLLKTILSNSSNDQLLVSPTAEKEVTDSTHLWNLLSTAFDRITEGKFSLSQKLDQTRSTYRSCFVFI